MKTDIKLRAILIVIPFGIAFWFLIGLAVLKLWGAYVS